MREREREICLGNVFKLEIASMSLEYWQTIFLIYKLNCLYAKKYKILSRNSNGSRESDHRCLVHVPSLLYDRSGTRDEGILPSLIRWLCHL